MKRRIALAAVIACCVAGRGLAEYSISESGQWPKTWPKELEPLRPHARTYQGPIDQLHYLIPFTDREQFEAAWPHLLKVATKGAPIILIRGPKQDFFEIKPVGVIIHAPGHEQPRDSEKPAIKEDDLWSRGSTTTFIELVVDGQIVDLNRIPLPLDTPIIDKRFKEAKAK